MLRSLMRRREVTPRIFAEGWLHPLREIYETMNQMFTDYFGRGFVEPGLMASGPVFNMYKDGEDLVIEALIPGLKKEDMEIHATSGSITIKGELKMDKEICEEEYYNREFYSGRFFRTIDLPYEIIPEKIKATYRDGWLKIRLPHREPEKIKGIKVKVV